MITVELKGADQYVKDLKTFAKKAIPYALKEALNGAAFEARRVWGDEIRNRLTTRNQYTARTALRVEKVKGFSPRNLYSKVGSIADYMAKQEHGGTTRGPIPGPAAAGQAPGGKRTKPVRVPNRLRALVAAKATRGKSRAQRNAIALSIAQRKGQKHVVFERPKGGKGLFRITGSKRKVNMRLVWALGRGVSHVSQHPTLEPTLRRIGPKLDSLMSDALLKQLKFHRILGY